ncbi:alpha/beta fold hydrolase [Paenibacillus sp. N1-5-1-14]|uniref:thioesterase II family protein n=1 Tax=Paenibacillus radicibacter TaxID=2972488 RepID=UPI002158A160|nr:alpha/beta fold hydrolase [Paenibacillus radicibacter]MCR8644646.1 alpha/beta fold hydrolase [Paenibacillus radicibacter]
MKLICFPYAGAHVNVFTELQKAMKQLEPATEVIAMEYAGHGKRFSERPYRSIHDNVADLLQKLRQSLSKSDEISLLGYSMGSLVTYELARNLLQEGYNIRKLIFMAGTPPHRIQTEDEEDLDDEALLQKCQIYGLIKEDQFASAQMRQLFLPALRSDIESVHLYNKINQYHCHQFDEAIDIAVFQGIEDRSVTDVDHWQDITQRDIQVYNYPAGHFFMNENQEEVIADIIYFLRRNSIHDELVRNIR